MAVESPQSFLDVAPPEGWSCRFLDDLVDEDRGISYGIVQPGNHDDSGVPIVRVNNLRNGCIETDDVMRVSAAVEAKYERTRLRGREVLLSLVGTLGECAVVPQELAGWNVARAVAVVPVKPEIDPQWIATCLRSQQLQHLIRTWATTTVQATLNPRDVRRLPIVLPPQEAIEWMMEVIGALDEKIELNRRMNRALEGMARAIFKAWFIDFEPVRWKMERKAGKKKTQRRKDAKARQQSDSFFASSRPGDFALSSFPGMPQEVFDQLPTRLVESELGPIPQGWEIKTLGNLVKELKNRVTPSAETESSPYVPIDCITSKSVYLGNSKSGEEARSSLVRFDEDDILFGAMRPYFHKVCLAPFSGTTRTTAFVLKPRLYEDLSFVLLLLSESSTIDFATQHSVGSTIPYAKWDNSLASMPIVHAEESIRNAFHSIVWPCLSLLKRSYFENRTLAALRDALLPKLISGEVRVGEAEQILERKDAMTQGRKGENQ